MKRGTGRADMEEAYAFFRRYYGAPPIVMGEPRQPIGEVRHLTGDDYAV